MSTYTVFDRSMGYWRADTYTGPDCGDLLDSYAIITDRRLVKALDRIAAHDQTTADLVRVILQYGPGFSVQGVD